MNTPKFLQSAIDILHARYAAMAQTGYHINPDVLEFDSPYLDADKLPGEVLGPGYNWVDDPNWLQDNLSLDKNGNPVIFIEGVGHVPIVIPGNDVVNAVLPDGTVVSTLSNAQVNPDGTETLGVIHATSAIGGVDGSRQIGHFLAGGQGNPYQYLNPAHYGPVMLLPNGTIVSVGGEGIYSILPEFNLPPGLNGAVRPNGYGDSANRNPGGGAVGAFVVGVDIFAGLVHESFGNDYATQVVLQENADGEVQAVIIASQIHSVLGATLLSNYYVGVDAEGKPASTPLIHPVTGDSPNIPLDPIQDTAVSAVPRTDYHLAVDYNPDAPSYHPPIPVPEPEPEPRNPPTTNNSFDHTVPPGDGHSSPTRNGGFNGAQPG